MGQRDSRWLERIGMLDLVLAMRMLSGDYGMSWAESWDAHLDEPDWLKRAMTNTFRLLKDTDRQVVRPLYEAWLWYAENFDLDAMMRQGLLLEVYLLDRNRQRISCDGQYKTIVLELQADSRQDALLQVNSDWYEFKCWVF